MLDVMFYEVFKEEQKALRKLLPLEVHARFVSATIQECAEMFPPAQLISVRTQSRIPLGYAPCGNIHAKPGLRPPCFLSSGIRQGHPVWVYPGTLFSGRGRAGRAYDDGSFTQTQETDGLFRRVLPRRIDRG